MVRSDLIPRIGVLAAGTLLQTFVFAGWSAGQDDPKEGVDATARYRLIERYSAKEPGSKGTLGAKAEASSKEGPGTSLTAYRAAYRETIKIVTDAAKGGAPDRKEMSGQAIWTERAAQVAASDPARVIAVVRHFEKLRTTPDLRTAPTDPPLLEGQDLYVRPRPDGGLPIVLTLQKDRPLLDQEFRLLARCPYGPDLASLLPAGAVHIGDSWRLPRASLQSLVSGGVVSEGTAVAKLTDIAPGPDGKKIATILINGQVPTGKGEAVVRAKAEFIVEVEKEITLRGPAATGDKPSIIQAHGGVFRLALAQEDLRVPSPDDPNRKQDLRRELVFERQFQFEGKAPDLPQDPPALRPSNSWITFLDPKGKFSLKYPQDMIGTMLDANVMLLQRRRPGADIELVRLTLVPGEQPQPDAVQDALKARWKELKTQVQTSNPPKGLPEADWPDKKVYRSDAILKLPRGAPANKALLYFFGYTVQSGGKNGLTVEASTTLDPPTGFRDQVEAILKTYVFGPPKKPTDESP